MFTQIILTDQALYDLTIAALEALELGDGREQGENRPCETYGYLLGSRKRHTADSLCYRVERANVSLSAYRTDVSCQPHRKALYLTTELARAFLPNHAVLGDFHSHPYEDYDEFREETKEGFSNDDHSHFTGDRQLWAVAKRPLSLLISTIVMDRICLESPPTRRLSENCVAFRYGIYRFQILAGVGMKEGKDRCLVDDPELIRLYVPPVVQLFM